MPGYETAREIEWLTGGTYGVKFKQDVRRYYGSFVYFDGRGEMIPNENSYCEIDPGGTKDKWGIPVLRFHWRWSEHELRQAAHMQRTFADIISAMGGRVAGTVETDDVNALVNGCIGVMHYLKMVNTGPKPIESPVWIERVTSVTSDVTGIFYPLVKRGTYVQRGQRVGYVTDYLGTTVQDARAPENGVILFIRAVPSMTKGETVANIGVPSTSK